MDKEKIGNYLKELRLSKKREDSKSFTQKDLTDEFLNRNQQIISENSISDWESGSTLPSIENLELLSQIYGKTIDEILDGEDRKDVNYEEIYLLSKPSWGSEFDDKADLYQIRNEKIRLITNRFRELIKIRIKRSLTANEEDEFRYLFENYYHVYHFTGDEYLFFKKTIAETLINLKNKTEEEKYWEIQKLYIEEDILNFSFRNDVNDLYNTPILQDRFKDIDDWQKDMLLAMFQTIEPHDARLEQIGAFYVNQYEKEHGVKYNHDSIVKKEIKELLERGACINKLFFCKKEEHTEIKRIIDRLEELYNLCLKPIKLYISCGDGKTRAYVVENSMKNRFLSDYYYRIKPLLEGFSTDNGELFSNIDDCFNWFTTTNSFSDDLFLDFSKMIKTRDKQKWQDKTIHLFSLQDIFKIIKDKERLIAEGLKEIDVLLDKLSKGEKEYVSKTFSIIGGTDENTIRLNTYKQKNRLDYEDYLKGRDKELTKEMLKDLDYLSLQDIKDKYFAMEVLSNE